MALMPRLNALRDDGAFARGGLRQRADQFRSDDEQASEDAALANGGSAAVIQTRINNLKSRAMAQNNPEWDEFAQSLRDVGDGRSVKLLGGPSPDGSNQITGLTSQRSPGAQTATEISSLRNGGGPYGIFGTGTGGVQPTGDGAIDALHGRVRPMLDSHDVWRAKTRQRIYGGE